MDLTESLTVYGFGSYFSATAEPNDIDLLLVHEFLSRSSCDFAILCKSTILRSVTKAHVTILSVHEEKEHDFIARARAIRLQEIDETSTASDLSALMRIIESRHITT